MCGRFYIADEDETGEIQRMIEQAAQRQQQILGEVTLRAGEICPGMCAPALALGKHSQPMVFPMEWGFGVQGKRVFNTRLETAEEKPLFRESFLARRCLLPMTHYFETGWEERAVPSLLGGQMAFQEKRRVRYAIRPAAEGPAYLAGIYRYEPGKRLPVFSVLTCAPDNSIAWLHDRMPVILGAGAGRAFLSDARAAEEREREMIFQAG